MASRQAILAQDGATTRSSFANAAFQPASAWPAGVRPVAQRHARLSPCVSSSRPTSAWLPSSASARTATAPRRPLEDLVSTPTRGPVCWTRERVAAAHAEIDRDGLARRVEVLGPVPARDLLGRSRPRTRARAVRRRREMDRLVRGGGRVAHVPVPSCWIVLRWRSSRSMRPHPHSQRRPRGSPRAALRHAGGPVGLAAGPRVISRRRRGLPVAGTPGGSARGLARLHGKTSRRSRAKGNDVVYAPTVNIMRTPLGARVRDLRRGPVPERRDGGRLDRGAQSTGVIGNVKHYAANNQEGAGPPIRAAGPAGRAALHRATALTVDVRSTSARCARSSCRSSRRR